MIHVAYNKYYRFHIDLLLYSTKNIPIALYNIIANKNLLLYLKLILIKLTQ